VTLGTDEILMLRLPKPMKRNNTSEKYNITRGVIVRESEVKQHVPPGPHDFTSSMSQGGDRNLLLSGCEDNRTVVHSRPLSHTATLIHTGKSDINSPQIPLKYYR
jgi:hypothetical protein